MKLVTVASEAVSFPGVLIGDQILDLNSTGHEALGGDMLDIVRRGDDALTAIATAIRSGVGRRIREDKVQLTAPIARPPKIVGIGFNYKDHAEETGAEPPRKPVIFAKFPTSVTGPFDEVRWPSIIAREVDYEVELGIVIGRGGRDISEGAALDRIFGYMVINDLSARDLQFSDHSGQWDLGKSLDGFCPCGPYLVTRDEVPDVQDLDLTCTLNGNVVQHSNTSRMIFSVRHLISYLSARFTLEPGDVIASGTPAGIGMVRKPPLYLKNGDVCVCQVERLGAQNTKIAID